MSIDIMSHTGGRMMAESELHSSTGILHVPLCRSLSINGGGSMIIKSDFHSNPTSPSYNAQIKGKIEDTLNTPETSHILLENKVHGLVDYYRSLVPEDKTQFIRALAVEFGVDTNAVQISVNNLTQAQRRGPGTILRSYDRLRLSLVPRYQNLFTQISRLEGGVKFLVDLRATCIGMMQANSADQDSPYLSSMSSCLRDLLSLWFSVGFLELERITWESPCDMLQKISDYEAVHPIRNWTDLKRRVGPYRRCFLFTHASMPREPVVVLHTALTNSISTSIQHIVQRSMLSGGEAAAAAHPQQEQTPDFTQSAADLNEKEDPQQITTAIFYSITSTQKGLQGVELGNYLIKSVVRELLTEFPRMNQFSSLSPIPGFRDWLLTEINKEISAHKVGENQEISVFEPMERKALTDVLGVCDADFLHTFRQHILTNSWIKVPAVCQAVQTPLTRLCARYLYQEKRRGYAINTVANFHLRNGAVMWRINWLADATPRGLGAACGMMVNYRYFLERTEQHSRDYMEKQTITASQQVLDLLTTTTSHTS